MSAFGGFDISSFAFRAPEEVPDWYEYRLHHMKDMEEYTRRAHIHSMAGSQGREHKQRLRLVLTAEDCYEPGSNPFSVTSYKVPGLSICEPLCEEVVIRRPDLRPDEEFVAKSRNGQAGVWRPTTNPAARVGGSALATTRPVLDL